MQLKNLILVFITFAASGFCLPQSSATSGIAKSDPAHAQPNVHGEINGDTFVTLEILPKQLVGDSMKVHNSAIDSHFANCKDNKDKKACVELRKMIIKEKLKTIE